MDNFSTSGNSVVAVQQRVVHSCFFSRLGYGHKSDPLQVHKIKSTWKNLRRMVRIVVCGKIRSKLCGFFHTDFILWTHRAVLEADPTRDCTLKVPSVWAILQSPNIISFVPYDRYRCTVVFLNGIIGNPKNPFPTISTMITHVRNVGSLYKLCFYALWTAYGKTRCHC